MTSPPGIAELFVSHWHLSATLVTIALLYALVYLIGVRRLHGGWPLHRTLSFISGVACVALALQSGIGTFDDRLLSVHMVQHMLLLMVAPLLLLAGHPVLLLLRALPRRRRPAVAGAVRRAARVFGPVQSLAVLSGVLVGTHLPAFYDAALKHPALHELEHVIYLFAGIVLWSPILDVDPAPQRRLGGLARIAYMLAAMPSMALIGAYLNRATSLVYAPYGPPAHTLGISAVTDQQQAGAIMWVVGDTIMVLVGLWAVMAALVAEERRQRAVDARAAAAAGLRETG